MKPMRTAWITGAADGIGKALAQQYGREGFAIRGVDFDEARSESTAESLRKEGIACDFHIADLTSSLDIERLCSDMAQEDPVDVVVHNAGISAVGPFEDSSIEENRRVIALNLLAPLTLTARLLEHDKVRDGGSIIFMSSLSHYVSYPGAACYAATKDGLASYARSLSVGLWPKIHVMRVFPGPTRTAHARRYSPDNSREDRRMPAEELARRIFNAQQARKKVLVPGASNRMIAHLGRFAPRTAEWIMKKSLFEVMMRSSKETV